MPKRGRMSTFHKKRKRTHWQKGNSCIMTYWSSNVVLTSPAKLWTLVHTTISPFSNWMCGPFPWYAVIPILLCGGLTLVCRLGTHQVLWSIIHQRCYSQRNFSHIPISTPPQLEPFLDPAHRSLSIADFLGTIQTKDQQRDVTKYTSTFLDKGYLDLSESFYMDAKMLEMSMNMPEGTAWAVWKAMDEYRQK